MADLSVVGIHATLRNYKICLYMYGFTSKNAITVNESYFLSICIKKCMGNMEITLASSPKVNTYASDRIKVAEYHAIYINFQKLINAKKKKKKKKI